MMRLDLKDRRMLRLLDSNARMPTSQIARKIGISPEVAHYRLKRLEKEGIITQYQVIVNLAALGIIQFKILIALEHIHSRGLEEIIARLKKKESIKWIVTCKGSWDILIAAETHNLRDIDMMKDDILSYFEGHVRESALSILIDAQASAREYLTSEKTQMRNMRPIMKKENIHRISAIEEKILKILAENARIQVIDIAARLKIDPRVVIYHMKKMEKEHIILGYKIALDYEKIGIQSYKVLISIGNMNGQRFKSLINHIRMHKNSTHHVKVLGSWELEPEFETESEQEFNNIMTEFKDNYADIIRKIDVLTILKEYKFVYF